MSKLIKHLALVSESALVPLGEVMTVAAALQKQTSRDLDPIWNISATVDAFENLEDIPLDYWPMIVRDDIGHNAAGIHLDNNKQPYALITSSEDRDIWSLTASHEALEMLVDPFGDRLVAGDSLHPDQTRVNFLVEVCDPSEAAEFAYTINSILVADFYTPHYFDPVPSTGVRYSFTDAIRKPRTILAGGYLSWHDMETNEWWQQIWFEGNAPRFRNLGQLNAQQSIRSQIDRITWEQTAKSISRGRKDALVAGMPLGRTRSAGRARADSLHAQIDELIAGE